MILLKIHILNNNPRYKMIGKSSGKWEYYVSK